MSDSKDGRVITMIRSRQSLTQDEEGMLAERCFRCFWSSLHLGYETCMGVRHVYDDTECHHCHDPCI